MARSQRPELAGVMDLFSKSYIVVKRNLGLFALLYAVSALTALWATITRYTSVEVGDQDRTWGSFIGSTVLGADIHTLNSPYFFGAGVALFAVLSIFAFVFSLMLTILTVRAAQGKTPDFKGIWNEFKQKGLRLLLLQILLGLIIAIGFILLIVPGVILLWRLFLAPYILIDKNTSIKEAIKQSWAMTPGYFSPIYAVILFGILLSLTSVLPFAGAVMALLLGATYSVAPALRYLEIKKLA